MDPIHYLAREAEHAQYLHHENDPQDPCYRAFLSKLADPLLARLPPGSEGLDFGCGPGPALAAMLREAGHSVALYDPFFAKNPAVLDGQYDFITCTEVAEHLHTPARVFRRLRRILRPGGCLAVMTAFLTDEARFTSWHYRKDPTHVVLYRAETFEKLAAQLAMTCEFPCKDVVLLNVSD
ncbi:MAG: class I SAM-dependent methyltransferase [Paracoccaceae bacterium]